MKSQQLDKEAWFNENLTELPKLHMIFNGLQPLFCISILFPGREENILFMQRVVRISNH